MRHEIETHHQKFELSLEEFDAFFSDFPEGISESNFNDYIANFEVMLSNKE
jgi:hypothetical protein